MWLANLAVLNLDLVSSYSVTLHHAAILDRYRLSNSTSISIWLVCRLVAKLQ